MAPKRRRPEDRFWPKVNKDGAVPEHRPELGPCWIWTASLGRGGYGAFAKGGKRGGMMLAHRFAYELLVGPIPADQEPDHLCRVKACVNPSHLEPVTHLENVRRGEASAWRRAMTHCKHGHLFDEANTRLDRQGKRICRTCERGRKRKAS